MIRMIQSMSAAHAKAYFSEALVKSDYYLNDQELNGVFHGKLSKRLGIEGIAAKEVFFALCENRHPETGARLTPRTKKERTVGYDINFHVPKSVSIIHALAKDDHIVRAFQESVTQTMRDIETDAKTGVRKKGEYANRVTSELLWVDFVHQTARPVEGHAPDPHLHAHCYMFNVTWDETEKRLKAGQFRDINADMPYYEALFHKRLSDRLMDLGYQIRRTQKSFEIEGVPQAAIDLFSKRTDEIGRVAKEKDITGAKELAELGARTRSKKQTGRTMAELREDWRRQIKELPAEKETDDQPIRFAQTKEQSRTVTKCVDYAISHWFERASVVPYRKLALAALKHGIGIKSSETDIEDAVRQDSRIIQVNEKGRLLCTTKEVLAEERRMVQLAKGGKGRMLQLYNEAPEIKATGQQAAAIAHVLTTKDMVSIIRGAAGAGKTTLMREAVALMQETGKQVTVVAPTARASRGVLREEGFEGAETVAMLLSSEKMQADLEGQILWVDEAGMLGTRDMLDLLQLATDRNARVVLGGDTRQHASVVRGDALRILNTVAGIIPAEVDKIYRQRDQHYRQAVSDLSKGLIREGFEKLDAIGAICEADPAHRHEKLVQDYLVALKAGKDALVISPTHEEGDRVTQAIRQALKDAKLLGKKEVNVTQLKSVNYTTAQKSDWRNLQPGMLVQFGQHAKGIKRGSVWTIDEAAEAGVVLKGRKGETVTLPLHHADRFEVYRKMELPLAKGDKVQVTRIGFDKGGKRLNNGQVLEVKCVTKAGKVLLTNAQGNFTFEIDKEFGHLSHAHCVTSHASQGRTVDQVFVAQAAATFPATNAKQFYVSVSRARESVSIYTDDREALLDYASKADDRQAATELIPDANTIHLDHLRHLHQQPGQGPKSNPSLNHDHQYLNNQNDYEPGF